MNGKELLLGLSYISPKYIEEAKNYSASQKRIRFRKPLLTAAVIAPDAVAGGVRGGGLCPDSHEARAAQCANDCSNG